MKKLEIITSLYAKRCITSSAIEEVKMSGGSHVTITGDGTWIISGYSPLIEVCTFFGGVKNEALSLFCN